MHSSRRADEGRDAVRRQAGKLHIPRDDDLRASIRAAGAGSREAAQFEQVLWEYGMGTLIKMYANNDLSWTKRGKTFSLSRGVLPVDPDERNSFFTEVVADTVRGFMTTCVFGDGWNPRGGATLTTYFVGRLQWRLWSLHKRLRTQAERTATPVADVALVPSPRFSTISGESVRDVAETVVERAVIEDLMSSIDASARDKMIYVRYHAQSWSCAEIATENGLSTSTVSRVLAQVQAKLGAEVRAREPR